MQKTVSSQKRAVFIAFIVLAISLLMITSPIPQDPAYHLLADSRYWLGVPNFANVLSNLPFAIVGLMGLVLCSKDNGKTRLSWLTFFIGLIFVAVGSGYYHLNPNNQTLVWDRLPMMISFMALFVAILTESLPELMKILFWLQLFCWGSPVSFIGIISTIYAFMVLCSLLHWSPYRLYFICLKAVIPIVTIFRMTCCFICSPRFLNWRTDFFLSKQGCCLVVIQLSICWLWQPHIVFI